jgi:hypothetical protein
MRGLIALLLVLAMPLRALAALAMPCCPAAATHTAVMADDGMPMPDTNHADQPHATFDCCALAMIALPVTAVAAAPYAPPFALLPRARPVAAFVTDAPERPPRPTTAAA